VVGSPGENHALPSKLQECLRPRHGPDIGGCRTTDSRRDRGSVGARCCRHTPSALRSSRPAASTHGIGRIGWVAVVVEAMRPNSEPPPVPSARRPDVRLEFVSRQSRSTGHSSRQSTCRPSTSLVDARPALQTPELQNIRRRTRVAVIHEGYLPTSSRRRLDRLTVKVQAAQTAASALLGRFEVGDPRLPQTQIPDPQSGAAVQATRGRSDRSQRSRISYRHTGVNRPKEPWCPNRDTVLPVGVGIGHAAQAFVAHLRV